MAGTASNRAEEMARVARSESNTYYSGKTGSAGPPIHEGFGPKKRNAKDPNSTSAGTSAPNGKRK